MISRRLITRSIGSRLSKEEKEVLGQLVHQHAKSDWRVRVTMLVSLLIGLALIFACTFLAWGIVAWLIGFGTPGVFALVAATICVPLVVIWVFRVLEQLLTRRYIGRALTDMGYPVCLHCAYLPKGIEGPVCPECGCAVEPAGSQTDEELSTAHEG
jgi:hypothetical protein